MIKHEELYSLYKKFMDEMQRAAQQAKTEDDFAVLENIATDVLNCMPITVLSCDYVARGTVASYLEEKDRQDTKKINEFMKQIYQDNVFHINDDYFCDDMEFAADKFYKSNKD